MPLGSATLALQALFVIHAARTGRMQPWLWMTLFVPGLGCLLYFVIELLPAWSQGRMGRHIAAGVVQTVAPTRTYKALARKVAIAPTVQNRMELAQEALALGRAYEAVDLYGECLTGLHATDAGLRMGLAQARFAAGDAEGTITELDRLRADTLERRNAEGHLLYARALEQVGRTDEALAEYRVLSGYAGGEEVRVRLGELLARTGAVEEAREQFAEVVSRVDLQGGAYRRTHREWYGAAKRALAAAP